jgi:Tol biopolymer transport system component
MVRPDGTGDHWATPDAPVSQYHPDWSPDGQRIAFEADDPRHPGESVNRDLWVSDANGASLQRVFDCELPCKDASNPAWSPDGQSLAFDVGDTKDNIDVNIRIAILDLQTRAVRTVFVAAGTDELLRPRWSPDGRTIVFETQRWTDGSSTGTLLGTAIATVPATGLTTRQTVITPWSLWAAYPDWHPTRDLVLFYTRPWTEFSTGPSNLYTARPDGSRRTQITHFTKGLTRATQPTFTPDGSHIIFTAVEGTGFGGPTMAEVALDGSGLTSATSSGPIFGTHPRLRPAVT